MTKIMTEDKSVIPLWIKIAFTAFMAVLVPVYATQYGPANFLYFCDVALFLTLIGLWLEDALPISMAAVGILAVQCIWLLDFALQFAGFQLTGMTDYMFDATKSQFLRGLSLFHGWLPLLLIYLVYRIGYDKRALLAWTLLAWLVLFVCYFLMSPPMLNPGNAAVNINYVYGFSETEPQSWMPPLAWFGLLLAGLPALLFFPTHLILLRSRKTMDVA